mmetsp:Transcript_528/g.1633  ORF Transcript_528/g.1633 Transcript_528/m.1633 type:complete len:212 (+) Transcript_528:194-829(+)
MARPHERRGDLVVRNGHGVTQDELALGQELLRELHQVFGGGLVRLRLVLREGAEADARVPQVLEVVLKVCAAPVQGPVHERLLGDVRRAVGARVVDLGQVPKNGVALGNDDITVLHDGHLPEGVHLQLLRRLVVAISDVHHLHFPAVVVQAEEDPGHHIHRDRQAINLDRTRSPGAIRVAGAVGAHRSGRAASGARSRTFERGRQGGGSEP